MRGAGFGPLPPSQAVSFSAANKRMTPQAADRRMAVLSIAWRLQWCSSRCLVLNAFGVANEAHGGGEGYEKAV